MPTAHLSAQETVDQELQKEDEKARQEFKLIPKEPEKIHALSECAKHHTPGMLWTQNQKLVFQTQLTHLDARHQTLAVSKPKEIEDQKIEEVLKTHSEIFFNLAHPTARLFFKAQLKLIDTNRLIFELPEKVFRVQRRNSFRLTLGSFHGLMVEFQHPESISKTLKKKLLDLSDLGLAFLVDLAEEPLFKKGQLLKRLNFQIQKQPLTLEAEVRYTRPIGAEPHEFSKVGVQFKAMKHETTQFISTFVMAENRKFISNAIK